MNDKLLRFSDKLRESYWFLPTIMATAALILALAMVYIDSHNGSSWMDRLPWLYAARPDGARSLLSAIGGSMIGVAGTTFSVTIAAVVYASGQYGPRLLSNFMADRGNQVTLGTFIATFLYSMIILRTIRSPGETAGVAGAFVPQLAVLVGVGLMMCSVAVLIYFIHHVPMRIHINSVIKQIGTRLLEQIGDEFPIPDGEPRPTTSDELRIPPIFCADADYSPDTAVGGRRYSVRSEVDGYIELIDGQALLEIACEKDLVIRLQYQPGDFIHRGSVLLEAWPDEHCDDRVEERLREMFETGSRRTALQDLRFLIDELVEIAARALSPGVNDPFTANACLDWLAAALADLARRDLPSRFRADNEGTLRVINLPITFAAFVDRGFGALAQYASTDMIAGSHFLRALREVAFDCDEPSRVAVIRRQAESFCDLVENNLKGATREAVLHCGNALLRALNEPDYQRRLYDDKSFAGGTA